MNPTCILENQHLRILPAGPVDTMVNVPGSKSLTNRFLLLAAVAAGDSTLVNPLHSDDTVYMRQALQSTGISVTEQANQWHIPGSPQWIRPRQVLFVGNAGTVMRFLAPMLATCAGGGTLTGNERMLLRPIGDLVNGLRQLHVTVDYQGREGYPPLHLNGTPQAAPIQIRGDASSQYLSGLLMALPLLTGTSRIEIEGDLVSRTYVAMTLDCMATMGVHVDIDQAFRRFDISGSQRYRPVQLTIEPDASTASYWFALPFMVGGEVLVKHVPKHSHQGDFGLLDILERMGATHQREGSGLRICGSQLNGITVDMNTQSDVAPTLAVIATRAKSPTTIRNIGNMRIKECDRIATLQTAFDQLGLRMTSGPDWMRIEPGAPTQSAILDPEDDHRMAMVYALLGWSFGGVSILDHHCVAKTYPKFFEEMGKVLTPI